MANLFPNELVQAVRQHRLIPFVGAGVSRGIQPGLFPGWRELLEELVNELHAQQIEEAAQKAAGHLAAGKFLEAAEVAFQQLGAFRFNRFLRRRFRKAQPSGADLSVVHALWRLRPSLVLTTNYDDVLAWGYPDVERLDNDQEDELALLDAEEHPEAPRVWHLHGTIHRLSTIILGGSDYQRLYGEAPAAGAEAEEEGKRQRQAYSAYAVALNRLHNRLAARPFLYVGFSLNDPYVLQEVKHVLQATNGKATPSFALMKRGEGNRAYLWANYHIQLIEYADHGWPLVEMLERLEQAAFKMTPPAPLPPPPRPPPHVLNRSAAPMPVPFSFPEEEKAGAAASAPPSPPPPPMQSAVPVPEPAPESPESLVPEFSPLPQVGRPALAAECAAVLEREGRLVLLAPRRGGTRRLAWEVAVGYAERVTWLSPPNHPDVTEADYCRELAGDEQVRDFAGLRAHLERRAARGGGVHLVALDNEWGSLQHLKMLDSLLWQLMDDSSGPEFRVLVAGGARSALLLHEMPVCSVFNGAPRRELPDFTPEEVRQLLEAAGREGRWAAAAHEATGGHPGLLTEVLLDGGPLDAEAVTRRLVASLVLREAVRERLHEDDWQNCAGPQHARWVLEELLGGRPVPRLDGLDHDVRHPVVRLYFDGLVRRDAAGRTVLRCEAVARIAAAALARPVRRAACP